MKRILVTIAALSIAAAACAQDPHAEHAAATSAVSTANTSVSQDWAKKKVDASPRHHEWVNVKSGTRTVGASGGYPAVKKKPRAVVMINEVFGWSDWVRMLADEVAE